MKEGGPETSGPPFPFPPMRAPTPEDDGKLIALAREGHPEAFRVLVERYEDGVYDLCLHMLSNRQDAEDVTQDTFLILYRNLAEYKPGHKLSNWLYTIALNRCRKMLHRRKILRFFSLDSAPEGEDAAAREPAALEPHPAAGLEKAEAERWMRKMLDALPENLRGPFILRYLEWMSYTEIAEALGLSLANVKVRLHRAKVALWKRFGKDAPAP